MTQQHTAATLTEADILAALRDCYDPASALNIVELGLVQSIAIALDPEAPGSGIPGVPPRHRVSISLILPILPDNDTDDSPIPALIQNRLAAFETISQTEVAILPNPTWKPDRISPLGRVQLAAHLNSRKAAHDLIQIKT